MNKNCVPSDYYFVDIFKIIPFGISSAPEVTQRLNDAIFNVIQDTNQISAKLKQWF